MTIQKSSLSVWGFALISLIVLTMGLPTPVLAQKYVWTTLAPSAPSSHAAEPLWQADHDRAVALARQQKYAESLAILSELYRAHSDDKGVVRDYLTVLGWAGNNDDNVARLYEYLGKDEQPDYVLYAAGLAYRNLKQPSDAAAVYQRGLSRSPDKEPMVVGLIRSLSEAGENEAALAAAETYTKKNGYHLDVLIAAGDAALLDKNPSALAYFKSALGIAPNNRAAIHGYILAADQGGWHRVAWESANNNPGALSPAEYREIVGNDAADLVRQGMNNQPRDHADYTTTDTAINQLNTLIAAWHREGYDAMPDLRRAQFDRVLALRNRSRMTEVITSYEALAQNGVQVPPYVLSSVADAYLNLREPEKARDIYVNLVAGNPNDIELRRQLFYAYTECGDYDQAFALADTLVMQAGNNTDKLVSAQLLAGAGRLYAGEVSAAAPMITAAASEMPHSSATEEAVGNLDMAHGWPRAAYEHYLAGANLQGGKDLFNEVGMANSNLATQLYGNAEAISSDLSQRYPDNIHVERLARDLDIHDMAEFRLNAGYAPDPLSGINVTGGENYGIDGTLYSSPFYTNWRVFAGEYFAYQREPGTEGQITLSRSSAGVEYRNYDFTISAAPTLSDYNSNQRVGGTVESTVSLDDQWSLAGRGEIMTRDVPLRALNSGVTADAGFGRVTWREDEETQATLGGSLMSFSDQNFRTSVYPSLVQRLYTDPIFYVDGLVDTGWSWNSENENRYYYNPSADFIGLVGARAVETLYHRYETLWQHSLTVSPGVYWQRNYGADGAVRVRYEHRLFLNNTFEAGLGVNYAHQCYDGNAEDDLGASLDLVARF